MKRQRQILDWAIRTFGPVARNRDERAARCVEEAVEIAQCEGVSEKVLHRIVDRVYSRSVGLVQQEIGGLAITLDALAENLWIDVQDMANREFERVLSLPQDHFARKHSEKAADGVANLSPSEPK